ncbi:MAG: hypothetical protein WCS94_19745 [Verrucomicrobiota bacterium]
MKNITKRLVFWTPRIICLLFAAFISLFALDVFAENQGVWNTLLALSIHLIPTALLLVILATSWRREWVGALIFPALGVFYIVNFWGRFRWPTYAIIAGPLFVLGGLFLLGWLTRSATSSPPK